MRRLGWLEQVRKEKTAGVTATRAKTIFFGLCVGVLGEGGANRRECDY